MAGHTGRYIVLVNGGPVDENLKWAQGYSKRIQIEHSLEPVPYTFARNGLVKLATTEYVVFFDNHCLPQNGYFERVLRSVKETDCDYLHGSYSPHIGNLTYFHQIAVEGDLKRADYSRVPFRDEPYRCMGGPHAGLVAKKSSWHGYWMGHEGYGLDEVYFNLSAWAKGLQCWLDPKLHYYHYSVREREYPRPRNTKWGPELDLEALQEKFEKENIAWR